MKKIIKQFTKMNNYLSKNKTHEIERNFGREYTKSLENYLKDEMKKYNDIDVIIFNRPKERK